MEFEVTIVNTKSGPVRGVKRDVSGVQYYTFYRIPYAKPPVGDLRFRAPTAIEPWTEVLDGTAEGFICPQISFGDFIPEIKNQSEDCLYLNVYKKIYEVNDKNNLPVVIMIHGGGFNVGSSGEMMGGPEFLLEHDIVYVSVNYRLGALGFLSIPDRSYDIPGNAGLKDQSMALRWIRENCAFFGGNPENITIMGISAGGASVHYHLISDHSKNLFHRAIIQSGSAMNSWANRPHNDDLNERVARALGWTGDGGNAAMWDTIINAPSADLVKCSKQAINENDFQNGMICSFVPTVEPYDNGTIFIDRDLPTMNRNAWSFHIPVVVGGCSGEGYLSHLEYTKRTYMFNDMAYFDNALPRELGLQLKCTERRRLGELLKHFYYESEEPTMENIDIYATLLTEKQFWHGIYGIVKARISIPNAAPNMMAGKHITKMIHADDMLYQFRMPAIHDNLDVDSDEVKMRKTYNSLCMTFAETGKPTSELTKNINWVPVQQSDPYKCLNLAPEPSVIDLPNAMRIAFWNTLYNY